MIIEIKNFKGEGRYTLTLEGKIISVFISETEPGLFTGQTRSGRFLNICVTNDAGSARRWLHKCNAYLYDAVRNRSTNHEVKSFWIPTRRVKAGAEESRFNDYGDSTDIIGVSWTRLVQKSPQKAEEHAKDYSEELARHGAETERINSIKAIKRVAKKIS